MPKLNGRIIPCNKDNVFSDVSVLRNLTLPVLRNPEFSSKSFSINCLLSENDPFNNDIILASIDSDAKSSELSPNIVIPSVFSK